MANKRNNVKYIREYNSMIMNKKNGPYLIKLLYEFESIQFCFYILECNEICVLVMCVCGGRGGGDGGR